MELEEFEAKSEFIEQNLKRTPTELQALEERTKIKQIV